MTTTDAADAKDPAESAELAEPPSATEPLDPEEQRRRRRRIFVLLAPLGLGFVASRIGVALMPTLLVHQPLVLIGLHPVVGHLLLVAPLVDPVPFYAVAVARLFVIDPFMYQIGREFGQDAVDWIKRRFGKGGRLIEWVERAFARYSIPILFAIPQAFPCLLSGAAKMNRVLFVVVNLAGTFTWVTIVRYFGGRFEGLILEVRDFIADHIVVLTGGTIAIVLVTTWLRRKRLRAADPRRADDAVIVDE